MGVKSQTFHPLFNPPPSRGKVEPAPAKAGDGGFSYWMPFYNGMTVKPLLQSYIRSVGTNSYAHDVIMAE